MMRREVTSEGFTMIELLVAMMVMLIVTVPLVASFVLGIQTTTQSQQDVTSSTDAQVLSEYLDVDVANSESANTSGGCSTTGTTVIVLTWNDAGTPSVVSYDLVPDSAAQVELNLATPVYQLVRTRCSSAGGPALESSFVARQLIAQGAVPAAAAKCDGVACGGISHPRLVSLQLQESSKLLTDLGTSTIFSFGVTSTRKVTP